MTYRETLARLGELAANVIEGERTIGIPTTWFDFYYRLTNEMTIDPSDGALIIECSPAVILALVKQAEEMRKALEYIVQRGYTGAEYVAREALAALDKEMP